MSFDRFKAQTLCENFLDCSSFDEFYQADFANFSLGKTEAFTFSNTLKEDANDLFYKGCLSLAEGINGIKNRQYSWAVVKCYYSVFYMLKADLALKDYGLIRHKTIYYLEAKEGAKPITKGRRGTNRMNYSGDHKSAINYYKDLFSGTDILLSQNITGVNAYEWLMKKREQINYQERYFNEPNAATFLSFIDTQVSSGNLKQLIKEIIEDRYIKTFQPEYATLAIPLKRAILTRQNFTNSGIALNISEDKSVYIKELLAILESTE